MIPGRVSVGTMAGLMAAALLTARVSTQTAAPQPPAGDARNGKTLFLKSGCYQCHGSEGQGRLAGPRLAPDPIPFRGLVAYVRAPRGERPPYAAKVISEQQLADVYAYLKARPQPPAVSSLPLLAR